MATAARLPRIALIAHDRMKPVIVALAAEFRDVLQRCQLCATGTTGGVTGPTGNTGTTACTTETWATVEPTLTTYCSSCHTWAKTYSGAVGKGAKIATKIRADSMPPASKPQPTTDEEAALLEWVDCGLPQ